MLTMLEDGATHLGVATDHVIESFRNDLWDDYKTGEGIDPELFAQFPLLEDALAALGVTVWPMVELEADDALASAAAVGAADDRVEQVDHLHARQGPRPVRRRQGRAARPPQGRSCSTPTACARSSACRRSRSPTGSRWSATAPTGFPGLPGFGAKTGGRAARALRPHRGDPRRRARSGTCPGVRGAERLAATLAAGREVAALLQGARDAAHRRRRRHRRRLGVARPDRPEFADWCERFGSPRLVERAAKLAAQTRSCVTMSDAVLVEHVRPRDHPDHAEPARAPERDELRRSSRGLLRRARRARRRPRVPRDRAHRRGARLLRRTRPHRRREPARRPRAWAAPRRA